MGLGSGIPDPEVKKAPDPEVKKAPDPESGYATLTSILLIIYISSKIAIKNDLKKTV
jgi:hypothetical protein